MNTEPAKIRSKIKKLTLVNPSKGFFKGIMPLGLVSIATYLKEYSDIQEIVILDSNCQDIYQCYEPSDLVGISAVTQDIKHAVWFAEFVKSKSDIPVILGGVHISTYKILPEIFDLGVVGEGEETMLELIALQHISIKDVQDIKGVCYNENGITKFTIPRPLIEPLDKIPIPNRDFAKMDFYLQNRQIIPYHSGRSLTLMSSRGCPFNCVFCSTRLHWQMFRGFSAQRVVEEIELLVNEYKAEIIHIFDDLFIADKVRFRAIHKMILEKGINKKVKFMCLVRSDMLNDEMMIALKEMNVVVAGIGMESGCSEMLEYLKRGTTTIEKNRYAIELANKYNLPTMGSFMIGNPGETEESLLKTLEFIRGYRYSPYLAPLSYISAAFPGTEFWAYAKNKGIDVENFDNVVMDIPNNIETIMLAPLLTDIPRERFFEMTKLFQKEAKYGGIKHHFFQPKTILSIIYALLRVIRIERSLIKGVKEFLRLYTNCKLVTAKSLKL